MKKIQIEELDSDSDAAEDSVLVLDSDAEDSVLVLDSVAQDPVLVLDSERVDLTTTLVFCTRAPSLKQHTDINPA